MNDNDVLDVVRDSLSGVHLHTPVEAIVARGRARRRHRVSVVAGAAVASLGLVVGSALVVQATDVRPPVVPPGIGRPAPAFTLVGNDDGTTTLTLLKVSALDPEVLRRSLADVGIPAVISVGSFCLPRVGKVPGLEEVVGNRRGDDGRLLLVLDRAAMPPGSQLSIGLKSEAAPGTKDRLRIALVRAGAPLECAPYR